MMLNSRSAISDTDGMMQPVAKCQRFLGQEGGQGKKPGKGRFYPRWQILSTLVAGKMTVGVLLIV